LGGLCITIGFVQKNHCGRVQGHKDMATKQQGYGQKVRPKQGFHRCKKIWDEITHSKEDNKHIHEEEKMDHESQ